MYKRQVYRTWEGGITLNRLTILGWNLINIGILVGLLLRQVRADRNTWAASMQAAFGMGCLLYTSDAADERSSVELGGRRIIKKKKTEKQMT